MKIILNILSLVLISTMGFGQAMTSAADSDPAAKKILDKLKAEYDTYNSMEVSFDLIMELPGQEAETQVGSVIQQGEMYKLELDDRAIYSNNEFVWVHVTAEPLLDGKKVTQIEFKPLDRDSEFSKLVLYVDKKSKKMAQMKVFSKDGGRYTLKINDIVPNKKYDLDVFTFDSSKYPGIHEEDLRID